MIVLPSCMQLVEKVKSLEAFKMKFILSQLTARARFIITIGLRQFKA